MRRTSIVLLVLAGLGLASLQPGFADSLKLVNATVVDQNGEPVANRSILIEGKKQPAFSNGWGYIGNQTVKSLAITDKKGYVQMVDMPPGQYTMKLLVPGGEPRKIETFDLPPGYQIKNVIVKDVEVPTNANQQ
jgi:hypothetical protein